VRALVRQNTIKEKNPGVAGEKAAIGKGDV